MGSWFLIVFLASRLICLIDAEDDSNKLWILLDTVNLYECKGVTNQFVINKDDVFVRDKNGNNVDYVEAPGDYFIEFRKIQVLKPLPNLNGHLGATLQIPLVSSNVVRLDFPYQVIPQKPILGALKCDNDSGAIIDVNDRRAYCRYCELCETSSRVEKKLASTDLGHVYVPKVAEGQESSFDKICQQIDKNTYSIKRSLTLPNKTELQREAKDKYKGSIEGVLQDKLKLGKGKLQIFLNVQSSDQSPVNANKFYANNQSCVCCKKNAKGDSNCKASWFELVQGQKSSQCLYCNNDYAQICLKGTQSRVGCYVCEYNFRVTDKRSDLDAFLKQLAATRQGKSVKGSVATDLGNGQAASSSGGQSAAAAGGQQASSNQAAAPKPQQTGGGGARPCDQCDAESCKQVMPGRTKNFCATMHLATTGSQRRFCCNQCPTVCSTSN